MSTKIGIILSLIFVSMFLILGGDLISLQYVYSDLDSKSVNISYLISKSGRVDKEFINKIEKDYQVTMNIDSTITPKFGDIVNFQISQKFDPLIMSSTTMDIKINKSAIIGYFG